jgi:antirestriction protein
LILCLDNIEAEEKAREAGAQKKTGDDAILEKMSEEGIDEGQLEAVKAYICLGIEIDDGLENFMESYSGKFDSDEDFAKDIAEQLGDIDSDAKWPHDCIDWEHAARELMYDYSEADGFYFRNI